MSRPTTVLTSSIAITLSGAATATTGVPYFQPTARAWCLLASCSGSSEAAAAFSG
jgi:hypothetical protein